jgi:NTP pyrophosphatase (non-canonical NTP hydrolase)
MKISEFQSLIRDLYFNKDKTRGIKPTFVWLIEEIGEFSRVIMEEEINIENASEELSDIIAWTNSLANLLEIDLESAISKKYPNMCPKCNLKPCNCSE